MYIGNFDGPDVQELTESGQHEGATLSWRESGASCAGEGPGRQQWCLSGCVGPACRVRLGAAPLRVGDFQSASCGEEMNANPGRTLFRHEGVSCFFFKKKKSDVGGFVFLPQSQTCRLLCDESSGQILCYHLCFVATSGCQSILWSKACDASLAGGAICRSVGLMACGLEASKGLQTSLCEDGVVLILQVAPFLFLEGGLYLVRKTACMRVT